MTTMSRFRRALRAFAAAWRGEGFVTRSEVEIIVCDVTERDARTNRRMTP
jgi:uncharacterized membrane protein